MPIFTSADCLLQVTNRYNVHLLIHSKDVHVHDESIHRRNEERDQGVPWAPPIRSKMGSIRSKIGDKRTKMGPFWGVVFHENNSSKSKFGSKGAELFWAPPIL